MGVSLLVLVGEESDDIFDHKNHLLRCRHISTFMKRGTDQDSPRFCFGVCVCEHVRVFIKEVGIGNHVSKSSTRIYN